MTAFEKIKDKADKTTKCANLWFSHLDFNSFVDSYVTENHV